jgi:transcriptional regulator with XRE-family HTH domain
MPPNKVGLSEAKRLYDSIRDKSDIRGMLESNPQNLLLVRLGMGCSLQGLSSVLGTSYVNISEIERGKRKAISKRLMDRIVLNSSPLPDFEEIEKNYEKITSLSSGGRRQAAKRSEKASYTESEMRLMRKLEQLDVEFVSHKTLNTSIGPVNVDFVIKTKSKTVMIEITDSTRKQKLESMSYRALKIKKALGNVLLVAVLPDRLTEALERRLEDFDIVLRFSDIGDLGKRLQLAPHAAV